MCGFFPRGSFAPPYLLTGLEGVVLLLVDCPGIGVSTLSKQCFSRGTTLAEYLRGHWTKQVIRGTVTPLWVDRKTQS